VTVACPDEESACDVSGDGVCCINLDSDEGECHADGSQCPGGEATVTCDGPAGCPGQECCFDFGAALVECRGTCGGGARIVCVDSGECDGNDECLPSMFLPEGYFVCQ
jgi:hypothetical protein